MAPVSGQTPLGRALDAASKWTPDIRVRHDHVVPGAPAPLDHLVIGPMGVFVVHTTAPGIIARHQQLGRVRAEVSDVRAVLDRAGLKALPATGLLCEPVADGQPLKYSGGAGIGDVTAVLDHLQSDVRFGPSTVRAALLALDPPPFVATVTPERVPAVKRTPVLA